MGLLSIFNRKKTAADTSPPAGRGAGKSRTAARPGPGAAMAASSDTAEAVREARARARRRLMGATVLLLAGVIGFPLLFETQPRPIPVDLPIDIPSRNAASGFDTGAPATARSAHGATGGVLAAVVPSGAGSATAGESVSYDARPSTSANAAPRTAVALAPARSDAPATTPARVDAPASAAATARPTEAPKTVATTPAAAPASKPAAPVHAAQAAPSASPSASSTAAAAALMGGPNAGDRYIVQVAAFRPTDDAKIRDIRGRVEKLGLKTYTQAAETAGVKWIRVRVGPYPTKAEADSAVAKIGAAGLGLQPKVYMP